MSPDPHPARGLWPLPAIAAWALAWSVALLLPRTGLASPALAWVAGAGAGALPALWPRVAATAWRRALVAGGFPASLLAAGLGAGVPAWAWLLPMGLLLAAYPLSAWRDAPVFPTPREALAGLDRLVAIPPGARLLDAGCGLGHGLQALAAAWPSACCEGIERSALLARLARLRCPGMAVRRGDMWSGSWAPYALVYLFQRPETMERAMAKAHAEMAPGAWLASLEFPVPGHEPDAVHRTPAGPRVWLYRMPRRQAQEAPEAEKAGIGHAIPPGGPAQAPRHLGR